MEKRRLGNTGIEVAPLALGTNVFGWTIDEVQSFKILDAFTDAGLNLVDTADFYSRWQPGNNGGESETIIGNWLKKSGKRDKIILATKVGADMGGDKKGLSKAYILKAVEASLTRLQTDHIDLYQSHFDDGVTPVQETMEAYFQLIKQGKVIVAGASNMTPQRLTDALYASRQNNLPTYQTLQPLYNLCERATFERDYQPICRENELSVLPYFSLASGFLTGKYRTERDLGKSARGQGVKKYMTENGLKLLAVMDEIAAQHQATPAAVALTWLMAQPTIAAPIASATTTEQLKELVKAMEIKLDDEELNKLNDCKIN